MTIHETARPESGLPFPDAVLPDYGGHGISSIPATVLQAFGSGLEGHPPLAADVIPPGFFDGVRTVILILLDGLGWGLLQRTLQKHPDLALGRLAREGCMARLTSVLPSTTTAALATLSTGLTPQEHGLIGYKMYLREVGEIANMIRFSPVARLTPYPRKKLNPQAFFDHNTLYQHLIEAGASSRVIIRSTYAKSPLSRMFYRGAELVTHAGTHDAFALLRRILLQRDGSPNFVYLYWDPVDTVSHHTGPNSEEVAAEIVGLDFALRTQVLEPFRGGDVALLVTADHGHVHTMPPRRLTFNACPELLELLERPPSGDSRLPYLHVKEGRLDEARRILDRALDGVVRGVPAADALAAGWFGLGDTHPEAASRLGDLVLAVANDYKVSYRYNAEEFESIGCHGGTDPEEMFVPFIAARL